MLAGAQQFVGLPEQLGLRIADDLAEPLVHLDEAAAAIGDGDAKVVLERLAIAVEAIGYACV
jgi:hypothetical protein